MPSVNWSKVRAAPGKSLKIIVLASWGTFRLTVARIVRPFARRPLCFRNEVARMWLGTTFVNNPEILYSEPASHDTQLIETIDFKSYVIPDIAPSDLKHADAVVIYCHGGGLIIGHPLQYLAEYKRWARGARAQGKKIVFLALQYPLSTTAKWPAQRKSLLALYEWTLAQSVPASKMVFAGDSAGCDLIYLTLMHIRDSRRDLPHPSCVISVSPWLDWTGAETIGSPNWQSDFMFYYDASCPILNNTLRPTDLPFDTPEISVVLADNVGALPPQLVIYSKDEILASDSVRWIKKSRAAGVDITEHAPSGEMHTFAVGWPVSGRKTQDQCDSLMLNYIFEHTKNA